MLQWRLRYRLLGIVLQSSDYQCREAVQESHTVQSLVQVLFVLFRCIFGQF